MKYKILFNSVRPSSIKNSSIRSMNNNKEEWIIISFCEFQLIMINGMSEGDSSTCQEGIWKVSERFLGDVWKVWLG